MDLSNDTFPELYTERLLLRKLSPGDELEVFAIRSNEIIHRYLERPRLKRSSEALDFINRINEGIKEGNWYYWGIVTKQASLFVGTICLWNFSPDLQTAEVGYELLPAHHGKGIMMEALTKVVEFGFNTLSLQSIDAYTHADNKASTRLLEKCSFEYSEAGSPPDEHTCQHYVLTRPKWMRI
ncbi:MAG: GNAT family N-acetyltransferase [Saprospiraceae bacterium]|nr:GNAT family N-acetyltransferase [Saprospiraceae bacterium]